MLATGKKQEQKQTKEELKAEKEEQKARQALAEFKKRLGKDADEWGNDITYKRFLVARNYNVDASFKMYQACVEWRKANKIDEIGEKVKEKMKIFNKFVYQRWHGFCKIGRPVFLDHTGRIHFPTLLKHLSLDDLVDIHVHFMEENARLCRESSEKLEKEVHQSVSVVDLHGLSFSHRFGLDFIRRIAKIDSDYYPETMGKLFIVNAPRLFGFFWGICKAWVDPKTAKKVEVLGSGAIGYEKLQTFIPASSLPSEYGGTCAPFNEELKEESKR